MLVGGHNLMTGKALPVSSCPEKTSTTLRYPILTLTQMHPPVACGSLHVPQRTPHMKRQRTELSVALKKKFSMLILPHNILVPYFPVPT
jgi:hypothetical protein